MTHAPSVFDAYINVYQNGGGWFPHGVAYNGALAFVSSSYLAKSTQLEMVYATARQMQLSNFYFAEFSRTLCVQDFDKRHYVLKPNVDAACGEAQCIIDTDKIPVGKLDRIIQDVDVDGLRELGLSLTIRNDLTEAQKADTAALQLNGLKKIKEAGVFVTEYVRNIQAEYRIITNAEGLPFASVHRTRTEVLPGFPQATAKTGSPVKVMTHQEFVAAHPCGAEIYDLIAALNTPLTGYDVYTTDDNKFGIFEFCTGFGLVNVPHRVLACEGKRFYANIAKEMERRMNT